MSCKLVPILLFEASPWEFFCYAMVLPEFHPLFFFFVVVVVSFEHGRLQADFAAELFLLLFQNRMLGMWFQRLLQVLPLPLCFYIFFFGYFFCANSMRGGSARGFLK